MKKETRAARIWAALEKALIGQLMSGSQLDLKRPYLIRLIGDRLTAENVDPDGVAVEDTRRCGRPQRQRTPSESTQTPAQTLAMIEQATHPLAEKIRRQMDDTITDAKWAAMVERAVHVHRNRMGYDDDDAVKYEEH